MGTPLGGPNFVYSFLTLHWRCLFSAYGRAFHGFSIAHGGFDVSFGWSWRPLGYETGPLSHHSCCMPVWVSPGYFHWQSWGRSASRLTFLASNNNVIPLLIYINRLSRFVSACMVVGQISSYYNVPNLATYCMPREVLNKTIFRTVIRISGSFTSIDKSFTALFQYYGWTRGVWLLSDGSDWCLGGWDMTTYMFSNGVPSQQFMSIPAVASYSFLKQLALDLKTRGRSEKKLHCCIIIF